MTKESTSNAILRYVLVTTGSAYSSRNLCPASVIGRALLVSVMALSPHRVNPGAATSAEDRAGQLRYLDQPVDADKERDEQRGQDGKRVRDANVPNDLEHRGQHLRKDVDEGRGNH